MPNTWSTLLVALSMGSAIAPAMAATAANNNWVELGQSENGIKFAVAQDSQLDQNGRFTGRQRLVMPYPDKCVNMEQLKASDPEMYARCDTALTNSVGIWIQHTEVDCRNKTVKGIVEEYINYKGQSLGDEPVNANWAPPSQAGFAGYLISQFCTDGR